MLSFGLCLLPGVQQSFSVLFPTIEICLAAPYPRLLKSQGAEVRQSLDDETAHCLIRF
jgi:hypothetical protein